MITATARLRLPGLVGSGLGQCLALNIGLVGSPRRIIPEIINGSTVVTELCKFTLERDARFRRDES